MKTNPDRFLFLLAAGFFIICVLTVGAAESSSSTIADEDRTAIEIGRAILAVDQALQFALPERATPEEVAKAEQLTKEMVRVGQMTRLYPWVSARLVGEISLAEHLLRDTRPDAARAEQLRQRLEYLRRVKLLIDAPY